MKRVYSWPSTLKKVLALCLFLTFAMVGQATAEDLKFAWTASPEPVTGYKLYYKTGSDSNPPYNGTGLQEGNSPITVPKGTQFTVRNRDVNQTYHFVLTSYGSDGESEYSAKATVGPLDSKAPVINLIRLK
jgi:hypothetical protein